MIYSREMIPLTGPDEYEKARVALAGLTASQIYRAAHESGLREWIRDGGNRHTLSTLAGNGAQALRMPAPSPLTHALRTELGYPKGVSTKHVGWTLGLSGEGPSEGSLNTGVALVGHYQPFDHSEERLHLPLDITVPYYSIAKARDRPDRIKVEVGDAQLPSSSFFREESAQELLLIAGNFLGILASGNAADFPTEKQTGLRRFMLGK